MGSKIIPCQLKQIHKPIIADYRYSVLYPNLIERRRMLPSIPVPEKYELLGPDDTMTTITQMRANGLGGSLLTAMLKEFAKKQFYQEKDISIPLLLEMELDQFSGLSEADKSAMLATGNVRRQDYIRSAYVKEFVKRAVAENAGFADIPYEQQVAIMDEYAEDVLSQLSVAGGQLPGNTGVAEPCDDDDLTTGNRQQATDLLPDNGIPPAASLVNPDSLPNDEDKGDVGVE